MPRMANYEQARGQILDGDFLLWHATSLLGMAICRGTGQAYSHASIAGWSKDRRLWNLEMVQWAGGRHQLLFDDVLRWPNSCEVWRPKAALYDGRGAVEQMLWLMGQHYGWGDFAAISVRLMFPHVMLPKPQDSDNPDVPRVCSASVRWAARTGSGFIPCPSKPDLLVTPGDLANPEESEYLFTLY